MRGLTRRGFLGALGSGAALAYTACTASTEPEAFQASRLHFNDRRPTRNPYLGVDVLYGTDFRRAYVRVPTGYQSSSPAPLVIAFHGAGGRGDAWMTGYGDRMDAAGIILLGPDSLLSTWDALTDDFGTDVEFVNQVVDQLFDRCAIDTNRIALLGFSDGASYALSLGLANGDRVLRTVTHSPGFYVDAPRHGQPSFFLSHGVSDSVLPIDQTSRLIVPALRALGDSVTYVEFSGRHEVPDTIADQAVAWLRA